MELQIGTTHEFIVKRINDISYTLYPVEDEYTDIFLHFNEATKELKENEKIKCFLYFDSKNRLAATMHLPTVTKDDIGFAEVVNVKERLGCFLSIGISKDILLSSDDLPKIESSWPKVGDKLPIKLHVKKDTIVCKIPSKNDLAKRPLKLNLKDQVEATVISFNNAGMICYTDDLDVIFIHKSMIRNFHHIGERINPVIVGKNDNKEYNGSLIDQKEKMMKKDADTILTYLKSMGGIAKVGNNSTPEEIFNIFHMSKGAFKRATGNLYKEHLISIDDYTIKLN